MSLGGQKENVSNKVNSPPIRDFMNERYQDIQFEPLFMGVTTKILVHCGVRNKNFES